MKKKVLIISYDYKPTPGGVAEYIDQVAQNLYKSGSDVTILSKYINGSISFDKKKPFDIHRIKSSNKLQSYLKGIIKFLHLHHRNKFNYVLIGHLYSDCELYSLLAKFFGIRIGLVTYAFELNKDAKLIRKVIVHMSLSLTNDIFSISRYTSDLLKNNGVKKEKIYLAHPGISKTFIENAVDDLKTYKRISNRPTILTLSRLIERKGIDNTIKAIDKVKKIIPNIKYVIAGSGPFEPQLKVLVRELKLEDHVKFTGFVPNSKKSSYYMQSDIFIMPSRKLENGDVEGFGIVYLEANAFEKPVIGGDSGGVPDAVEHEVNGLLVNPYSVEEIADAIILLVKDIKLAKKLGKQGFQRVKEKFLWKYTTKHIINTIKATN